jgi:hypothetical protein
MKASHIIAAAASVLFPTLAHAGLLGSTIDVTARDPDASTIYADPGPVLVTNSVEYPVDSYVARAVPAWTESEGDSRIGGNRIHR